MASLTRATPTAARSIATDTRRAVRDSLIVVAAGQVERVLGTITSLALRWGLDPGRMGVYTGLRLYLDNTNRSSLGVGLGAVQEIPILRAAGREGDARHVADVAHTTNLLTCLIYALALIGWAIVRRPIVAADPLAAEWTWGLVAVAGLAILKRYESFLIAALRARQEFVVTSQVDVVEALVSIAAISLGLLIAGFWGLLGAVGLIIGAKIAFLHARIDYRFGFAWDLATTGRLMVIGLPILANTAVFGAVMSVDRLVILWRLPDPDRALGLYSVALMGTGWSLDLAGRIVTVLYPYFQTALGRTGDLAEVARRAIRATEIQAPVLAIGAGVAYFAGPAFLGAIVPRYAEGLPALRPLLPGAVALGLAWPSRQMLIAAGRPYRLALATAVGLMISVLAGLIGADRGGIVGVALGTSVGYLAVFALTAMAAYGPTVGPRAFLIHLARLGLIVGSIGVGVAIADAIEPGLGRWGDPIARVAILGLWSLPPLVAVAVRSGWLGLISPPRSA